MIEIEKGVPIPEAKSNAKYPFKKMGIGDSFYVSSDNQNIATAANARFSPVRFVSRKERDGYRVWRVK